MTSLLIRGGTLYQTRPPANAPLRGAQMGILPSIQEGFILIEDGKISRIGPLSDAPGRADEMIDGTGRLIIPCWCDSHSHLVFARSREEEFVQRIQGLSYEEIAARGGGILNSAAKLRTLSEEDLLARAWERLQEVMAFGTGALEVKSGYGLSIESELKMLRVIQQLKEQAPIPIRATFLGAHAIPAEYRHDRQAYVNLIVEEMLPRIAAEGLADYIDVFCDRGFFTVDEGAQIVEAGTRYGLKPKIHVSQIANLGGVQMGVHHGAVSVDHLECIGQEEVNLLSGSATIATLLPSCSFFLRSPYPPARALIDSGAAVALASDYNPGSTPSGKMPFVISLACIQMGMLPEEAVNAATINGACAMELQDKVGVLSPGCHANLIITKRVPSLAYLPYAFGSDHISQVIISGKTVFREDSRAN